MEIFSQSRRKFITTLTLLLASGGLLVRYLTPVTSGKRRVLASAVAADVPPGGALVFRAERLVLMKDDGAGFYALSLICTHLGCTVTVTEVALSCPCHGSRFDRQGKVLSGPANRSLTRMQVEVRGEMVEIIG